MAWKFGEYFRAALLNRWNLLAVAGGAALASVSGHAQWALTALLAAEAAYLGFATGHPRFRALVDRESSPAPRNLGRRKRSSRDLAARLLNSLPTESQDRFKRLRT